MRIFISSIFLLLFSPAISQVSVESLQQIANLKSTDSVALMEANNIIEKLGYTSSGNGKWSRVSGKITELVFLINTPSGVLVRYASKNSETADSLVSQFKKNGNVIFDSSEFYLQHFRTADNNLFYEILYEEDIKFCRINISRFENYVKIDNPRRVIVNDIKKGGAWKEFLVNNLNSTVPVKNGAPAGLYTVIVRFVVDEKGDVIYVKSETNHGYGMEKEAERVIKLSPKWEPAIKEGKPVKALRRQPISFVVMD